MIGWRILPLTYIRILKGKLDWTGLGYKLIFEHSEFEIGVVHLEMCLVGI